MHIEDDEVEEIKLLEVIDEVDDDEELEVEQLELMRNDVDADDNEKIEERVLVMLDDDEVELEVIEEMRVLDMEVRDEQEYKVVSVEHQFGMLDDEVDLNDIVDV